MRVCVCVCFFFSFLYSSNVMILFSSSRKKKLKEHLFVFLSSPWAFFFFFFFCLFTFHGIHSLEEQYDQSDDHCFLAGRTLLDVSRVDHSRTIDTALPRCLCRWTHYRTHALSIRRESPTQFGRFCGRRCLCHHPSSRRQHLPRTYCRLHYTTVATCRL